jgi:hypothetical protein
MVCIRLHGPDAKRPISSDGLQLAPKLVGSPRLLMPPEVSARILIHGLTGSIDGKKYPGVMESMKRQDDEWMAAALTFVRIFSDRSNETQFQVNPCVVDLWSEGCFCRARSPRHRRTHLQPDCRQLPSDGSCR